MTFALGGQEERYALKLDFLDANPGVRPVGRDQTEAIISYFKGSPEEWQTGLPTYAEVVYPDLWPGSSWPWPRRPARRPTWPGANT